MSPDDWSTLIASVLTGAGTLIGVWAMAGKTRAETARIRSEIQAMRDGLVTNHGSTSTGNAIDRLTEASDRQEAAIAALAEDVTASRVSIGGLRDDVREMRRETSGRFGGVDDRVKGVEDRISSHESSCPARIPLARAIHHPLNPSDH